MVALAALVSCARLPGCDRPLAELREAKGRVERDFAARPRRWQPAVIGAELQRGDGLHTGPSATAVLRVGRNGTLRVESDTTLRLLLSGDTQGDASPVLEVESGNAVLEAGETSLPLKTRRGTALLQAGSRVRRDASNARNDLF